MRKLFLKATYLFLFLLFAKLSYAATVTGDISAEVIENAVSVGGGSEIISEVYDEVAIEDLKVVSTVTAGREGEEYVYEGTVIYDMTAEPNTMISVQYQSGDNNESLQKTGGEITQITKVNFEYNSQLMSFDKNGISRLRIKPSFFVENNPFKTDYRAVYYVTLLY